MKVAARVALLLVILVTCTMLLLPIVFRSRKLAAKPVRPEGKQAIVEKLPPHDIPKLDILFLRSSGSTIAKHGSKSPDELCVLHVPSCSVETLLTASSSNGLPGDSIYEARLAGDGSRILFTLGRKRYRVSPELTDIWLYTLKNKHLRRLTSDGQGYGELEWSLNGRYVSGYGHRAWVTDQMPSTDSNRPYRDLYVWNLLTGRRALVAKYANGNQWTQNGYRLLAITDNNELWAWDSLSGRRCRITSDIGSIPLAATWTSDGKKVIFTSYSRLDMLIASAPDYQIVPFAPHLGFYRAFWSPDSSMLAYMSANRDDRGLKLLFVRDRISIPLLKRRDILSNELYLLPVWSPDSKALALAVTSLHIGNTPYTTEVLTVDVHSHTARSLINLSGDARVLGWSRDGKMLVVLHEPNYLPSMPERPTSICLISVKDRKSNEILLPVDSAHKYTSYEDIRLR